MLLSNFTYYYGVPCFFFPFFKIKLKNICRRLRARFLPPDAAVKRYEKYFLTNSPRLPHTATRNYSFSPLNITNYRILNFNHFPGHGDVLNHFSDPFSQRRLRFIEQ